MISLSQPQIQFAAQPNRANLSEPIRNAFTYRAWKKVKDVTIIELDRPGTQFTWRLLVREESLLFPVLCRHQSEFALAGLIAFIR